MFWKEMKQKGRGEAVPLLQILIQSNDDVMYVPIHTQYMAMVLFQDLNFIFA